MITVEYYDREKHGYVDDCDYVVTRALQAEDSVIALAQKVADSLSPYDFITYEHFDCIMYFCCHG